MRYPIFPTYFRLWGSQDLCSFFRIHLREGCKSVQKTCPEILCVFTYQGITLEIPPPSCENPEKQGGVIWIKSKKKYLGRGGGPRISRKNRRLRRALEYQNILNNILKKVSFQKNVYSSTRHIAFESSLGFNVENSV